MLELGDGFDVAEHPECCEETEFVSATYRDLCDDLQVYICFYLDITYTGLIFKT